jgi:hypothetical protein
MRLGGKSCPKPFAASDSLGLLVSSCIFIEEDRNLISTFRAEWSYK